MNDGPILKFENAAVVRHNEHWFLAADAVRVIQEARLQRVELLGFDGAWIEGDSITLFQADSWDYCSRVFPTQIDPYAHAIAFVQERAERGLHFVIVLAD